MGMITVESDTQHPVYTAFEAVGFNEDDLVDPAEMTAEDLKAYDWYLVRWTSHGVELFDVSEDDLTDAVHGSIDQGVEFIEDAVQPIDFADEHGLLFEEIDSMEALRAAADPNVTFFARRGYRVTPSFSKREAVEALSLWGSEGWVPRDTADAMAAAFGAKYGGPSFRDDPHVDGEKIIRAPTVARRLGGADDDVESLSADSDIIGHKKTRRQVFYRNLDALEDEYGG